MNFSAPGYKVEYKGHFSMQRGGLDYLIRSDVDYEVRYCFSLWLESKLEILFIEIRSSWLGKLLFRIIYKVPSFSKNSFLDVFESLLSQVAKEKKKEVLMGEFNIDLLNPDDRVDFLNTMLLSYLYPLVTIPTRIMHSSVTLIDNIFVDGQLLNGCTADVLVNDG